MSTKFLGKACPCGPCNSKAFSLTEILVALLVIGLLLAAMIPVMTKKSRETLSVKGRNNYAVLAYGDINCPAASNQDLDNGNASCSGNFLVPDGVTELTVTVVGAGGGGGAGNASGYAEYTTPGTSSFTVPYGSTDINATLISGGAGGGAGGVVTTYWEKLASNTDSTQDWTWTIPNQAKGKNVIIEACAGGGGGGAGGNNNCGSNIHYGGGGGAGEYTKKSFLLTDVSSSLYFRFGGGGGGGAVGWLVNGTSSGLCGGGGGAGYYPRYSSCPTGFGGALGSLDTIAQPCTYSATDGQGGTGGAMGGTSRFSGGQGTVFCGGGGSAVTGTVPDWVSPRYPGGGGGGGGATMVSTVNNFGSTILSTIGGGGGSGGSLGDASNLGMAACTSPSITTSSTILGGAGGGGGGPATGNKGRGASVQAGDYWGRRGYSGDGTGGDYGGTNAVSNFWLGSTVAEKPSTWSNNCDGGNQRATGLPGAARITYLDYGPGGSGGAGATIDALRNLSAIPGEALTVIVGSGGKGGSAGYINSSGTVVQPTVGIGGNLDAAVQSILKRGTNILQTTHDSSHNPSGGSPTGKLGNFGPESCTGYCPRLYVSGGSLSSRIEPCLVNGAWRGCNGRAAGDIANTEQICTPYFAWPTIVANGTIGGRGGHIETPWFTCTPGPGGTLSSPDGGNGQGYGCGGGGGYGLGKGGDGSGGYARLEYNPSNIGSGGGGGAGYTANKIKISVTSRETIPYTIGAGGIGGKIINNTSTPSKSGGTTTFNTGSKLIQAGGGFGGGNVSTSSNTIINGTAGNNASICTVAGTTSSICKFGSATPTPGSNSKGGNGGASLQGPGGQGGAPSDNILMARGITSSPQLGSGGSGAATYINPPTSTITPAYPQGGQGGHGVIIVEWK